MNDKNVENRTEDLMGIIAEVLIQSRKKYAETILDEKEQTLTVFDNENSGMSERERVSKYCGRRERHKNREFLKRIAAIGLAALMVAGATITSSEAARKVIYNAIFEQHKDHFVIVFGAGDKEVPVYKDFVVTYVPDGYEPVVVEREFVENRGGAILHAVYALGDKELRIDIVPRDMVQLLIDNETLLLEVVDFEGIEGNYFFSDGLTILLWSDGRYEYKISGELDVEDYIEISKGLKGIEG